MKYLIDWLDHRTGCRKLLHEALYENVPGGSRWRYVWGSALTFALFVQFVTGLFLWMAYTPGAQTAWESVYYIQHEMTGGWLLRGIHHFTAQLMTVMLVLHFMQVVIDGAYKAPRELNFWFGLGLLGLVLALSLTGYLLPWDQKGYWATRVATNIAGITPVIGPQLQRLIIGGAEYGHHTLTRFFALHAGWLPAAVVVFVAGHIYLFRRHGLTAAEPRRKRDEPFWPDQVLKDSVAALDVMATVLLLIVWPRLTGSGAPLGAELTAPADPAEQFSAARPEWYFLFLFQLLKYFPGESEIWGAIILPSVLMGVVCLMPFLGRWRLGHLFNISLLVSIIAGASLLTWQAKQEDGRSESYQLAARAAEHDAERAKILARSPAGIPSSGAVTLLRNDPFTQGPRLFARNCASCHRYGGHDGMGAQPKDAPSASELKGFASREWVSGLLDPQRVDSTNHFGGTKLRDGKMVKFVKKDVAAFGPEDKGRLQTAIKALSAEAGLKSQQAVDKQDADAIAQGRDAIRSSALRCTECHAFGKPDEDATAPELTGYGSRAWMVSFISDSSHARFYGKRNDRMPRFGKDQILDDAAIGLIVDWLRGDWYEPTVTSAKESHAAAR
ncbi:MAG: cytochrome b N-terminal domain-containing protein [Verrucomicrobia bacterium]|nr:cytochrome b N-terminal domain-containing protein [Verrucomicrobiota bacterium]